MEFVNLIQKCGESSIEFKYFRIADLADYTVFTDFIGDIYTIRFRKTMISIVEIKLI